MTASPANKINFMSGGLERVQRLERYLSADPQNTVLMADLARERLYAGEHERALSLFKQLLHKQGDSADLRNWMGICSLAKGDWDNAAHDFAQALVMDPNGAELWFNRGYAELANKRAQTAVVYFQHAVELAPENTRFRYYLVLALENIGDDAAARTELTTLLTQEPDSVQGRILEGYFKLNEGHLLEAQQLAKTLQKQAPDHPGSIKFSAHICLLNMDPQGALAILSRMSKEDSETNTISGFALLMKHESVQARAAFARALEFSPRSMETQYGLAWAMLCEDGYHEAEQVLTAMLHTEPQNADALGLMGLLHACQRHQQQADSFINQALAVDANNIVALLAKATVEHTDSQDTVSGKQLMEAVFNENPYKLFGWTGQALMEQALNSPAAQLLAEKIKTKSSP